MIFSFDLKKFMPVMTNDSRQLYAFEINKNPDFHISDILATFECYPILGDGKIIEGGVSVLMPKHLLMPIWVSSEFSVAKY